MKNLVTSFLIAGALTMVPAVALAGNCQFVPGETVLKHTKASDELIAQYLKDISLARTASGIDTSKLAKMVAILMVQKGSINEVVPECRNEEKVALGFLSVNNLSGAMTEAQFAERVRTTGFKLPASAHSAPPPSAALPAQPPVAQSTLPSAVVNYQPQIESLEKRIKALEARPIHTLSDSEKAQLRNLPETLKAFKAAQAAAEAARKTAQEQAAKATEQATLAASSAAAAATAQSAAATSARDAAKERGLAEKAKKDAQASARNADKSAKAAKGWSGKDWLFLFLGVLGVLALAVTVLRILFGGGSSGDVGALETKVNGLNGEVETLKSTVNTVRNEVGTMHDRLPADIRLPDDWQQQSMKFTGGTEYELPVLVQQDDQNYEPRFVVTVKKMGDDEVEVLSGIHGHNSANLVKIANLQAMVRRAGFNNRLNVPYVPPAP